MLEASELLKQKQHGAERQEDLRYSESLIHPSSLFCRVRLNQKLLLSLLNFYHKFIELSITYLTLFIDSGFEAKKSICSLKLCIH